MIKVLTVFGTRPEAIKMAPLVKKIETNNYFQSIVCVTAQHREMLDTVLDLFSIYPDFDLDIMKHGQTLSDITSKVMVGVDQVIKKVKPDLILVHGDPTTSFATSLAGFYNQVYIGHVEAGLRSGNIYSPYPEEMNRKLTGALANLHFAPTLGNKENLLKEGINSEDIVVTGNTVIDALMKMIENHYIFEDNILNNIDYQRKKIIVLTTHRRENWGKPMENIFLAIRDIVQKFDDVEVVFPIHLNPQIRKLAREVLGTTKGINIIEPLSYKSFANLMNICHLVLTDSGGLQEEAPALGKPVLVLRTETERPEAVNAGTVKVVGVDRDRIFAETSKLLNCYEEYRIMSNAVNPYGDGSASERIINELLKRFLKSE